MPVRTVERSGVPDAIQVADHTAAQERGCLATGVGGRCKNIGTFTLGRARCGYDMNMIDARPPRPDGRTTTLPLIFCSMAASA